MKGNRQTPLQELWETINAKLRGHYQYYGVSDNWGHLLKYRGQVLKLLYKWLNRRSQRSKLNWVNFNTMIRHYPLAKPKSLININSARLCKEVHVGSRMPKLGTSGSERAKSRERLATHPSGHTALGP